MSKKILFNEKNNYVWKNIMNEKKGLICKKNYLWKKNLFKKIMYEKKNMYEKNCLWKKKLILSYLILIII